MRECEVMVVGAGPAGGQCARQLTAAGHRVLLVDRVADFAQNNFSSAGSPLEVLNDFQIPSATVGAFWNNLHCSSKNFSHTWSSLHPQGVVFDFKKLRQFLANEIIKTGRGELLLGYAFKEITARNGGSEVVLENVATKEPVTVKTQVVVDATGPARAVIYSPNDAQPKYSQAAGLEYLVAVDDKTVQRLGPNTLHFFVGPYFVPRGYGWIFPMNNNTFKVGVGSYDYAKGQAASP